MMPIQTTEESPKVILGRYVRCDDIECPARIMDKWSKNGCHYHLATEANHE